MATDNTILKQAARTRRRRWCRDGLQPRWIWVIGLPFTILLTSISTGNEPAPSRPNTRPLFPINEGGRWGFIDSTGARVLPAKYEDFLGDQSLSAGMDFLGQGAGSMVRWMQESPISDSLIGVRSNGSWGFVTREGRLAVPFQLEGASRFAEERSAATRDSVWGYINPSGDWVIPPRYSYAGRFRGGIADVKIEKWGIIRLDGSFLVEPRWDGLDPWPQFSDNRMAVAANGKLGYVDRAGTAVIPPKYDLPWGGLTGTERFSEGLAPVYVGKKYGYIDTLGQMVVPPRFTTAWAFTGGRAVVEIDDRYHVIDRAGKVLDTLPVESVAMGHYLRVRKGGKVGLMEHSGKIVVPIRFDNVGDFSGGLAPAQAGKQHGFIDRTGAFVREVPFRVGKLSDGMAEVYSERSKKGSRWGFIDTLGALSIPPRFKSVDRFKRGLAWAVAGDTIGFVDKRGRFVWYGMFPEFAKSIQD